MTGVLIPGVTRRLPAVSSKPWMLRVAVLSYFLPRPGYKRGGIERVAHDIADGLARRGHSVTVYSHDPKPDAAAYDRRSLPWGAFVQTWAGQRLTMGYLGNVQALIPRYVDADVILAHGDSLLLPLRRRPVLRVVHGSALDEARTATSLGRRVLQAGVYVGELLSAATQETVAVSENTKRSNPLVRRVIPNGVNRAVFHPEPTERAPTPTILFVGTLTGRKRGNWLLEQFTTRIRPAVPSAELHMICGSDIRLPGVTFHAAVSDAELAMWYRRAWVYASPSVYEGFGLPYLEALASGTTVVATPNPGSREVLGGGGCGRLADDNAFADAVIELLQDGERRRTFEQAGLMRAASFDLEGTVDAYEALLTEMVALRG